MPNTMPILKRLYITQIPLLGTCLSYQFPDFMVTFDLTDSDKQKNTHSHKQNIMFCSFQQGAVLLR